MLRNNNIPDIARAISCSSLHYILLFPANLIYKIVTNGTPLPIIRNDSLHSVYLLPTSVYSAKSHNNYDSAKLPHLF